MTLEVAIARMMSYRPDAENVLVVDRSCNWKPNKPGSTVAMLVTKGAHQVHRVADNNGYNYILYAANVWYMPNAPMASAIYVYFSGVDEVEVGVIEAEPSEIIKGWEGAALTV